MSRWIALCALAITSVTLHLSRADAGGVSTGKTPLSDMAPGELYLGFEGGLYPGVSNTPPQAHLDAALTRAQQIEPLDATGQSDPASGVIVMLSIGMSNSAHEFAVFERQEDVNANRNARLVLINGGQGGQAASIIQDTTAPYWNLVNERLTGMGLTSEQVQVVWLKQANANPPNNFPIHAQDLQADLAQIASNLHDKFPNLKLCYLSNRTYGGYATTTLSPEPQAYETGFADKWVIEQQINGDPALNFDSSQGPVVAPLLLWGPDLWADGLTPRSDGLIWEIDDFESADGTHPAPGAEQKVADLLSSFFVSDPTAAQWFNNSPRVLLLSADAIEDAYVVSSSPNNNHGADPELFFGGPDSAAQTYLQFPGVNPIGTVLWAKLSLRVPTSGISIPSLIQPVDDLTWQEETLTFANAPSAAGDPSASTPLMSRDGTFAANALSNVLAPGANQGLSFIISASAPGGIAGILESKEAVLGAFPPRLIIAVQLPSPDINGDGMVGSADLALLLGQWGPCQSPCQADLNGDGIVASADLAILLGSWGV